MPDSCDFEDFLAHMRTEGYEVKLDKNLSFRAPGQERFTRSKTLGADYTLEALKERLSLRRGMPAEVKTVSPPVGKKVNKLIDIQAKLQAGKGKGYEQYEQWATIYNLKEASKTLNFLTDNGVTDYEDLEMLARDAEEEFNNASARIKQFEARLSELSSLRTHIITRDVYAAYRKSKKIYRDRHADEIEKHEAAKKAFDKLGGATIPKVAEIQAEFSSLLAEKKSQYEIYKTARKDMLDYQTAKQISTVCCASSHRRKSTAKPNGDIDFLS